jgi:adenylate cyclase
MVEEWVDAAPIADLNLKGFARPIAAMEILSWREDQEIVETVKPAAAAAGRPG